jgi:poly(hydroxyalkanoate) depolymerase family esterase
MTTDFQPAMAEALQLTCSGKLGEATALIQAALAGGITPPRTRASARAVTLIDAISRKVTVSLDEPPSAPGLASPAAPIDTGRAGGTFERRSDSGSANELAYHLYIPKGATPGMPLVVMLHGCTQTPEDFARGTGMNMLADELGFLVAYPAQSKAANPQRCWNWFKPGDQQRDRGEPALIAAITRQVIVEQCADPTRVYVAGLSAGGAAAAIMAAAYPDLYAAVGIHSGLACGAARDLPSALAAMRGGGRAASARSGDRFVPVITVHGDRDATVHESNSREIIAAASAVSGGTLCTRTESGSLGGRRYTRMVSLSEEDRVLIEQWTIHGGSHAWSGGDRSGSYTDPTGPDASREMIRFFLSHKLSNPFVPGPG